MKFDYIIGNPPYQEENIGNNNQAKPLYHLFMDEAFKIGEKVELITPARFLSNQGATPKSWNEKNLNDKHLKIEKYFPKSSDVFSGVDIKGGVAITYRDNLSVLGPIETFIPFSELSSIFQKIQEVEGKNFSNLGNIVYSPDSYRFSDTLFEENPTLTTRTDKQHRKAVSSSVFSRYPEIFFEDRESDKYVGIYGREKGKRITKFVLRKYIGEHPNLDKWKVFVPGANGTGAFGESLALPVIGQPEIGHNQTFVSIGSFENEYQAVALLKYIKSKFARALLGIMKTTQNNQSKKTWSKIPIQDFTAFSDIDWSKSIPEIDQQLYKKYGLTPEEIDFIETHVKEMQ